MKYISLFFISSVIFCQTVTSSKYPISIEIPNNWQIREFIPKSEEKYGITLYFSSPNRFLYNMANMHREFVYIAVKKNDKPYNGILSASDRSDHLKEIQNKNKKQKSSNLIKAKEIREYEENEAHHLLFESQMPAYNTQVHNLIHHVIQEDYTYILVAMTLVDDYLEENRKILNEVLNSFTY